MKEYLKLDFGDKNGDGMRFVSYPELYKPKQHPKYSHRLILVDVSPMYLMKPILKPKSLIVYKIKPYDQFYSRALCVLLYLTANENKYRETREKDLFKSFYFIQSKI